MQGWRLSNEDSHICEVDLGEGVSFFGVFDGHGGPEVAKFCKMHFKSSLVKNTAYKNKDYKLALE